MTDKGVFLKLLIFMPVIGSLTMIMLIMLMMMAFIGFGILIIFSLDIDFS